MAIKWKGKTPWRQKPEKPHPRGKSECRSSKSEALSPNTGFEFGFSSLEFPAMPGIFLRIVAETAEEDRAAGGKRITQYSRPGTTPWFPGQETRELSPGVNRQAGYLRSEGHKVVFSLPGKARVEGYETRREKLQTSCVPH